MIVLTLPQATTAWVLGLALGVDSLDELPSPDWGEVLAEANRERCAVLAWYRSGSRIRRDAPAGVTLAWRLLAVQASERARVQSAALQAISHTLSDRGVRSVAMKGLPLAHRLYGEISARMTADIDLFVPAPDRETAAKSMAALGWTRLGGEAPFEEVFERDDHEHRLHVEIHTGLTSPIVNHLNPGDPESAELALPGGTVRAHAGPLVPAYLALHCAGHWMPPLLWYVDFATLWGKLTPAERTDARHAATEAGLVRYLDWAIGRAEQAAKASRGDRGALIELGIHGGTRHDEHPFVRHLRLAPGVTATIALLAAAIAPPDLRSSPRRLARRWFERLRSPRLRLIGRLRG